MKKSWLRYSLGRQGIYIVLEDGRKVLDAVGGAAVACIGNGHPEVIKAVQDQVEKLSCVYLWWCTRSSLMGTFETDVYNMQLSNEPAEQLANDLVASGNGAFELCGFVSGGHSFHSLGNSEVLV
jgi:E3 ubiquitin-protein ligase TRIP12